MVRTVKIGVFQTKYLTNGDQWKEDNVTVETDVFDRICMFSFDHLRVLQDYIQAAQVNCILLSLAWAP
jgi:hypothetical protein